MAKRKRTSWFRERKKQAARKKRRLSVEPLEDRVLMVSDWQNACNVFDATNDGHVTPFDVLIPINRLNTVGGGALPLPKPAGSPSYDTNGNGSLEPNDVLLVVNQLNGVSSNSIFSFRGGLENDTAANGTTNDDAITADATLSGRMSSRHGFDAIEAQVDGGAPIEVQRTCGNFSFDPGLAGNGLDDGQHTVSFIGRDSFGKSERLT